MYYSCTSLFISTPVDRRSSVGTGERSKIPYTPLVAFCTFPVTVSVCNFYPRLHKMFNYYNVKTYGR